MSSLRTKNVVKGELVYPILPNITNVNKDMIMDFSRIYEKPYLIDTESWSTASGAFTLLNPIPLPSSMLSNTTAKIPFDMSCLYRMNGCVMVQVAGTIQHQGLILVGVIPFDAPAIVSPNQLLLGPHAFLSANEATSVCIELPYYSRHHLNKTNSITTNIVGNNTPDFARVEFYVMSPLRTTATGSSSITITTYIKLNNTEFYIPKVTPGIYAAQSFTSDLYKIPTKIFDGLAIGAKMVTGDFIDTLRTGLRAFTGFHNPNSPAINYRAIRSAVNFINNVDQPTLFEKLDPFAQHDRIVRDYQFSTSQDEMDMRYILSKPVWVGKFGVSTATPAGKVLFNIPISPMVEYLDSNYFSPMRLAYESSRYWRGSLRLHIQAVSTNFHFTKILVAKDYISNISSLASTLTMDTVHNMPTDTLEFSGGGQIQTIELPYCTQDEQIECTRDPYRNGLQHGIVHGYLVQPLVTSGAVPTAIEFHVYMSGGDDLQFYGYSTDPIANLNNAAQLAEIAREVKALELKYEKALREEDMERSEITPLDASRKMFAQSAEAETILGASGQADVMIEKIASAEDQLRSDDFHPIVSVRDYVRRMQLTDVVRTTVPDRLTYTYSVSDIFRSKTPLGAFSRLYHGMTGGMKIRVLLTIERATRPPMVKYLPPGTWLPGGAIQPEPTVPIDFTLLPETTGGYTASTMRQDHAAFTNINGTSHAYTFEFVIPNMSPKRFITPHLNNYPSDLGFLLFTCYAPESSPLEIKVFAGLADEARLGYQVISSGYAVPLVGGARLTLYGMQAPRPFDPLAFPGMYYFNPVV